MNKLDKLIALEQQLRDLTNVEGLCVAIMYHASPIKLVVWNLDDNASIDTETEVVTFEVQGKELRTLSSGTRYLPSEILGMKFTLDDWMNKEED